MKRVVSSIVLLLVLSISSSAFSQERNVIVNTNSVGRTVITTNPNSNGNVDIWAQLEQERIAAEKAEQERIAAEKAEQERIAAEKAEQERIAAEKAEQERIAAEKKAEQERIAAEKKAEQERIAAEKAEQERIAAEKAEQERIAAEKKAEQERIAAEKKAEQERIAAEKKAEQERIAAEKNAEQERIAAEKKAEQERIAAEKKAEQERIAAEKKANSDSVKTARKERIAAYPWSNFVMLNGAYALYPEYAFGITYARVKQYGFYVSAMMNPSIRFHADHYGSASGAIDGEYPFYSGKHTSTRISATAGALVRLHIPMYLYAGVGYGYRGLFYETTEHEWVAWRTANTIYHGMHWEAGLMGNIKGFVISLGVSSITDFSNMYYEAKLGLGYCF